MTYLPWSHLVSYRLSGKSPFDPFGCSAGELKSARIYKKQPELDPMSAV